MTGQRRLGLVAAGATLLAAAPLSSIFANWTWLLQSTIAVGLIAGTAMLSRSLRAPRWAQVVAMVAALLLVLTWMFPSGDELLSLLPTPDTFAWFGQLLVEAGEDTRAYGVPVPDRNGLLFLTVLGIGGVAILVDLLTVGLRRPALAGLPMLAIYSVPVAVYVDSVPILPFAVGAVGFLWLLVSDNIDRVRRFGRRFTGDGRDVDVWEPSPLAAAGRRLAAIGVAAAVLVPLAVPGLTGGLLSQITRSGVGGAGVGGGVGNGTVDLFAKLSGDLTQNATTELARVTTNEPDPYYLRFATADNVTPDGFTTLAPNGRPVTQTLPEPINGGESRRWRAQIKITDKFDMPYAPIYSNAVDVDDLDAKWLYDPNAQVIFSPNASIREREYSVEYVRPSYPPEELRQAQPLGEGSAIERYTQVPSDPAVEAIVANLIRNERTEYDKVRAIYNYFSLENGFTYSLTTGPSTGGSQIASFLVNKSGYCQQYAAAMAWMVRVAGVPSRVAFGFTKGSNPNAGTSVLTNRNLHAWTEVYFNGYGWLPFDATPVSGVPGAARSAWAPDTNRVEPTASASASAAAPGAASSASAAADSTARERALDELTAGPGGSDSTAGGWSTRALLTVAGVALVLALLAVPAIRRSLVRRRRHAATAPSGPAVALAGGAQAGPDGVVVTTEAIRSRADAHAAWDELVDTMIDFKVPVDPTETPRHTAERLVTVVELTGESADAAVLLGLAEERARYARRPLQGSELTAALRQVRRALAGSSGRRTRAVALLLPPSVMLRWRLAVADLSSRWAGEIGRRREAATRWNPRRLLAGRAGR